MFQKNMSFQEIINLLNERTKESIIKAVQLLQKIFMNDDEEDVGIEFSNCHDVAKSPIYGFYTARANAIRIVICYDILKDPFNQIRSKTIRYDPKKICHCAVVVLHEFGHVLKKRQYSNPYGSKDVSNDEEDADAFAQGIIDSLNTRQVGVFYV